METYGDIWRHIETLVTLTSIMCTAAEGWAGCSDKQGYIWCHPCMDPIQGFQKKCHIEMSYFSSLIDAIIALV